MKGLMSIGRRNDDVCEEGQEATPAVASLSNTNHETRPFYSAIKTIRSTHRKCSCLSFRSAEIENKSL